MAYPGRGRPTPQSLADPMRVTLQDVLDATGGHLLRTRRMPATVLITGVSTDTRTLRPGELFVPLRGPRSDGHAFLPHAFRQGASAALCVHDQDDLPADAPLVQVVDPLRALGAIAATYRRRLSIPVVGITGSVGKTTTTKMIAAALSARFRVAQSREEWNAEVGVPLTILGLTGEEGVVVIEMAMRGLGQIAELVAIAAPTIGVVTTIGDAHLEFLGTRENIARAKGELIAGLPPDGTAVLNADDPAVAALASLHRGRVLTYGLDASAEVSAERLRATREGVHFYLRAGAQGADVALATWGRHNVRNALAAAAVGVVMGMAPAQIADGLRRFTPAAKRLEPVHFDDVLLLNDTYNASPASMLAAFDVLAELVPSHQRIAVLGEMRELGAQSRALHAYVGRALAGHGVRVMITVGDDARAMAAGAAAAGMPAEALHHARTHADATVLLRRLLRPGDVVLVKGSRAMELEHIVHNLRKTSPSAAGTDRGTL